MAENARNNYEEEINMNTEYNHNEYDEEFYTSIIDLDDDIVFEQTTKENVDVAFETYRFCSQDNNALQELKALITQKDVTAKEFQQLYVEIMQEEASKGPDIQEFYNAYNDLEDINNEIKQIKREIFEVQNQKENGEMRAVEADDRLTQLNKRLQQRQSYFDQAYSETMETARNIINAWDLNHLHGMEFSKEEFELAYPQNEDLYEMFENNSKEIGLLISLAETEIEIANDYIEHDDGSYEIGMDTDYNGYNNMADRMDYNFSYLSKVLDQAPEIVIARQISQYEREDNWNQIGRILAGKSEEEIKKIESCLANQHEAALIRLNIFEARFTETTPQEYFEQHPESPLKNKWQELQEKCNDDGYAKAITAAEIMAQHPELLEGKELRTLVEEAAQKAEAALMHEKKQDQLLSQLQEKMTKAVDFTEEPIPTHWLKDPALWNSSDFHDDAIFNKRIDDPENGFNVSYNAYGVEILSPVPTEKKQAIFEHIQTTVEQGLGQYNIPFQYNSIAKTVEAMTINRSDKIFDKEKLGFDLGRYAPDGCSGSFYEVDQNKILPTYKFRKDLSDLEKDTVIIKEACKEAIALAHEWNGHVQYEGRDLDEMIRRAVEVGLDRCHIAMNVDKDLNLTITDKYSGSKGPTASALLNILDVKDVESRVLCTLANERQAFEMVTDINNTLSEIKQNLGLENEQQKTADIEVNKIIVHDGVFHADDVMCVAMAKAINPEVEVVRTRNPSQEEIDANGKDGIYVADVGRGKFDHHQQDAETRDDGNKYAACGLLFNEWKNKLFPECEAAQKYFEEVYIKPIEQADNGIAPNGLSSAIHQFVPEWNSSQTMDDAFKEAVEFIGHIVEAVELKTEQEINPEKMFEIPKDLMANIHEPNSFEIMVKDSLSEEFMSETLTGKKYISSDIINPYLLDNCGGYCGDNYTIHYDDCNDLLAYAMGNDYLPDDYMPEPENFEFSDYTRGSIYENERYWMAKEIAKHYIENLQAKEQAHDQVLEAYEKSDNKEIVNLESYKPWHEVLATPENDAKFVIYEPSSKNGVNLQCVPPTPESFDKKVPMPEAWQENRPEGCTFIHPAGFLAAFDSVEHATKAAEQALEIYREKEQVQEYAQKAEHLVDDLEKTLRNELNGVSYCAPATALEQQQFSLEENPKYAEMKQEIAAAPDNITKYVNLEKLACQILTDQFGEQNFELKNPDVELGQFADKLAEEYSTQTHQMIEHMKEFLANARDELNLECEYELETPSKDSQEQDIEHEKENPMNDEWER